MQPVSHFLNFGKFGVFDSNCLLCGCLAKNKTCLCNDCLNELPFILHACPTCGIPVAENNLRCGQCMSDPPPFHQAVSVLHYVAPVDYLIKRMKYHNQLEITALMAELLLDRLRNQNIDLPELIIPVPLHIERLQQRGYNQAVELARPLSRALKIPVNLTSCIRQRNTKAQFELTPQERKTNLKGAFAIVHPLKVKHVALIDDIMTTGSTLRELSQLLLQSGVEEVDIWTCARASIE